MEKYNNNYYIILNRCAIIYNEIIICPTTGESCYRL